MKSSRREKAHTTLRINIASELQDHTGTVGLGWILSKEDGGLITESQVWHVGQNTCTVELKAVS